MTKRTVVVLLLLGVMGCAPMSPYVRLNPAMPSAPVTVKNHPPLYLMVEDSRPSTSLGTLAPRANEKPQSVEAMVRVEDVVRTHLTDGLTKAGFKILGNPTPTSSQLMVQINELGFKVAKAGASSELTCSGRLTLAAQVGKKSRTKTYSEENGQKWAFAPPVDGHERYLNLLLTDILSNFLTDQTFLNFLSANTQK